MLLDMNQGNWNILESNCGSISLHMPQPHLWVKASHVHVFGGTITVNFRYTSLHDFVKIAQTTLAHSYLYRWHWTTFALWLLWNIDPVNWTFHVDGTWTWLNVFWCFLICIIDFYTGYLTVCFSFFWEILILPHRPHGGRFAKPSGWQVRWVHLLEGLSERCNCGLGLSFYTTSQWLKSRKPLHITWADPGRIYNGTQVCLNFAVAFLSFSCVK